MPFSGDIRVENKNIERLFCHTCGQGQRGFIDVSARSRHVFVPLLSILKTPNPVFIPQQRRARVPTCLPTALANEVFFGVVIFEVGWARLVIDPTLPKNQISLAGWVMRWQRQHLLEAIMDPRLDGDFFLSESLKKF